MWTGIAKIILRNRIAILVIVCLLTLFMGYQARNVSVSYKFARILPKDAPAYIDYQQYKKVFSDEGNTIAIAIKNKGFFSPDVLSAVA